MMKTISGKLMFSTEALLRIFRTQYSFEKKFVGFSSTIQKEEVKNLIRTATPPGTHHTKLELLHAIGVFIDESSEEGEH